MAETKDEQEEREEEEFFGASRLAARQVFEVIRRDGEEELLRPNSSLVWSGIAAGILINFSVLGEAFFSRAPARRLMENADCQLRLQRGFPDGHSRPHAVVHREHHHADHAAERKPETVLPRDVAALVDRVSGQYGRNDYRCRVHHLHQCPDPGLFRGCPGHLQTCC